MPTVMSVSGAAPALDTDQSGELAALPLLLDGLGAIAAGLHEHCRGHDAATDPAGFARAILGDFEGLLAAAAVIR